MKIPRTSATSQDVKKASEAIKKVPHKQDPTVEFINSGSTGLNLAASQKGTDGGWARGRIINFVGDGSSGKTLLALEIAAYCVHNMVGTTSANFPPVRKVEVYYDNVEGVMDFPVNEMYGSDFKSRVNWRRSKNVEDFGRKFGELLVKNKPGTMLIYILDSLDALGSEAGVARFDKSIKTQKPEDDSYGSGPEKAKYLSQSFFENICAKQEGGTDVTLIIISQIRANIGITYGKKYRRNGGKALDFYTHQVCWLYVKEKLKKIVRGEKKVYGVRVDAIFERNKVAKPFRSMEIMILFDYGLDDVGTSLAYCYGPKVEKLEWEGESFSREELINHIEENHLQPELDEMITSIWESDEEKIKPHRMKRY